MKHAISTYLIACVLSLVVAQADVPGQINYQGRLTDSNGDPVTGSKTLDVAIYDAASGGNLLYRETIGAVTLDASGIYRFQFGSEGDGVAAAIAGAPEHWLEISVDGVKQATRDRVLAVPFALNAARAESSDDGVSAVTFDVDGNLIVTLKDGSQINAGQVREARDWQRELLGFDADEFSSYEGTFDFSADGKILVDYNQSVGAIDTYLIDGETLFTIDSSILDLGGSFDLSADGKTVAGGGRAFRMADGQWVQLGADVDLVAEGREIGATSISADGNTMAVEAYEEYDVISDSYPTYIRVYRFDGLSWQQLGGDIRDEFRNYDSPSISADGNTLAVTVKEYDEINDSEAWYIRAYRFDGLSWQQLGGDIRNDSYDYFWPFISDNGQTLAFSADIFLGTDPDTGDLLLPYISEARVYRYNGSNWQKLGADFNDDANHEITSISGDGNTVAVKLFYGIYFDRQDARIYRYDGSRWQQLGSDILFGLRDYANYEASGARLNTLRLTADGNTVVLHGITDGYSDTRIYRLSP